MARVVVTEPAKQDVRAILTELSALAGHSVAARYAEDFKAAYRALAQFPPALARRVLRPGSRRASRSFTPTC